MASVVFQHSSSITPNSTNTFDKCINNNNIIITLFQEDNIFGRVASLIYGPRCKMYIRDKLGHRKHHIIVILIYLNGCEFC